MSRDPRRDPRPGDKIEFDEHERWEAIAIKGDSIQYALVMNLPICSMQLIKTMTLECWRMLARKATILEIAPEPS